MTCYSTYPIRTAEICASQVHGSPVAEPVPWRHLSGIAATTAASPWQHLEMAWITPSYSSDDNSPKNTIQTKHIFGQHDGTFCKSHSYSILFRFVGIYLQFLIEDKHG